MSNYKVQVVTPTVSNNSPQKFTSATTHNTTTTQAPNKTQLIGIACSIGTLVLSTSVVIGMLLAPWAAAFGQGSFALLFCDIVWTVDLLLCILLLCINASSTHMSMQKGNIQQILVGVVLCVPWDMLLVGDISVIGVVSPANRALVSFRLLRGYRLDGFQKPLAFLQRHLCHRTTCHQPVVRLIKLMVFIATFSHVCACFYVLAGSSTKIELMFASSNVTLNTTNIISSSNNSNTITNSSSNISATWIEHYNNKHNHALDATNLYLRALHMSVQTLLTVGFGDSPPRSTAGNVLMLCLAFIGAVVYSLMIAALTSIVKNVAAVSNSRQTIKEMSSYLELQGTPPEFQRKVTKYLRQIGRRFGGMNEDDIFEKCFSSEMKHHSMIRLANVMYDVPLFHSFGFSFCHALVKLGRRETFLTGEMLVRKEEFRPEMMIVIEGNAVGIKENDTIVEHYDQGSAIGVYGALFRGIHAMNEIDVRAETMCDMIIVSQEQIQKVLLYPSFQKVQQAVSFIKNNKITAADATTSESSIDSSDSDHVNNSMISALHATIQAHKSNQERRLSYVEPLIGGNDCDTEKTLERLNDVENPSGTIMESNGSTKLEIASGNSSFRHQSLQTIEDCILIAVILWVAFVLPYRAACVHTSVLPQDLPMPPPFAWTIDYICDIMMIIFYALRRQRTKTNGNILLVVVTIFPFDVLALVQEDWELWVTLRLLRLLLVFYFPDFLRSTLRIMGRFGIEHLSTREEVLMTIISVVILMIHWLACLFQTVHGDTSYVRAIYWSLVSVSTTGFGELPPERNSEYIFSVATMYIGATIFAALIASLASMQSARITPHNAKYRAQVLTQLCETMSVPKDITKNVLDYDQHRTTMVGNCDEETLINKILPNHYKIEWEKILKLGSVQHSILFSKCSTQLQQMIVENLDTCFASQGEVIATLDDSCPGMFFMVEGRAIERINRTSSRRDLLPYDCFGETTLFKKLKNDNNEDSSQVEAIEHCQLFILPKDKLLAIVEKLPELHTVLAKVANELSDNSKHPRHKKTFEPSVSTRRNKNKGYKKTKSETPTPSGTISMKLLKMVQVLTPLILILYIYLLPFQAAFLVHWKLSYVSIIFDLIAYVVLIAEVLTSLPQKETTRKDKQNDNDGNGSENDEVAVDEKIKYKNSWLCKKTNSWILDIIALVPWELGTSLLVSKTVGTLQAYAFLRLPKLLLLKNYVRFSKSLESALTKVQDTCNEQVCTLGGLVLLFSTCGHVLACSWFALSIQSTLVVDNTWAASYHGLGSNGDGGGLLSSCTVNFNNDNYTAAAAAGAAVTMTVGTTSTSLCGGQPVPSATMHNWYVASIYYIFVALTTVGYGDIVAVNNREYIFTIFTIILGTFILVYVLSKLEKIVANIDVASTLFNRKAEVLHEYIKLRKLPHKLEVRVNEYLDLSWKHRCGATISESMSYLGTRQRVQIIMSQIQPILKTIPVLKYYPSRTLSMLVQHFQVELLLPNQSKCVGCS